MLTVAKNNNLLPFILYINRYIHICKNVDTCEFYLFIDEILRSCKNFAFLNLIT